MPILLSYKVNTKSMGLSLYDLLSIPNPGERKTQLLGARGNEREGYSSIRRARSSPRAFFLINGKDIHDSFIKSVNYSAASGNK